MKNYILKRAFRSLTSTKALYLYSKIGLVVTTGLAVYETVQAKKEYDSRDYSYYKDKFEENKKEAVTDFIKNDAKVYIRYAAPILISLACTSLSVHYLNKKYMNKLYFLEKGTIHTIINRDVATGVLGGSILGASVSEKEKVVEIENEFNKKRLFYDEYSKQYFWSTMAEVYGAEYDLNRDFIKLGAVPLSKWYEYLGINRGNIDDCEIFDDHSIDSSVGWSWEAYETYGYSWIDFYHIPYDDCCIIRFAPENPPAYYNPDTDTWDELNDRQKDLLTTNNMGEYF